MTGSGQAMARVSINFLVFALVACVQTRALASEIAPGGSGYIVALPSVRYVAKTETTPAASVAPDQELMLPLGGPSSGAKADFQAEEGSDCVGLRVGMFLTTGSDTAESDPLLCGALYHQSRRIGGAGDARPAWEIALGMVKAEKIGLLESRPITGEINVLFPLRGNPSARGYLVAGSGVLFEIVGDEMLGRTYYNYSGVVNLGGGATFAGGRYDLRLTYGRLLGSRGATGQAALTFGYAF